MANYEPGPGSNVWAATNEAAKMARDLNDDVAFKFDGIALCCSPYSDPQDVVQIYGLKCEIERMKRR